MKQTLSIVILSLFITTAFSQAVSIGKIDSIKDASNNITTYIGEIKNKKPNGVGVAIYGTGDILRYSGYFVNGKYEGKGALIYTDGSFLSGDFKAGKLTGQGANYTKNKDLYTGEFVDNKRTGKGIVIFGDNSFIQGNFKNDVYDGRCILVTKAGDVLADNMYTDGKKNGSGYQYEMSSKKLFEGTWANNDWVSASTANYNSFLKSDRFSAEKTDDHVLMGIVAGKDNLLQDTSYYYDLTYKKRYFGQYRNGFLENGLTIRDDSTRFIGHLTTDGANGNGCFLKLGKFYDEGNYVNDYLSGNKNISIDIDKKTVYYGGITGKGEFTGQSWFANSSNELYNGKYVNGLLEEGWRIDKTGYVVKGSWEKGIISKVTSLYNDKGELINTSPKTFSEALSTVSNAYPSYYYGIQGKDDYNNNFDAMEVFYASLIRFPGTSTSDVIGSDFDFYNYYIATFLETDDFLKAKEKYDYLCNQVKTATVTLKKGVSLKLAGNINAAYETKKFNISEYTLPDNTNGFSGYAVTVVLKENKNADHKYVVALACGDKIGIESWDAK